MYAYYDRERVDCLDNTNNQSLVFNELANKFLFDGVLKGQMEFEKDVIKRESQASKLYYHFKLDRTNLVYSERWQVTDEVAVRWLNPPDIENTLRMHGFNQFKNCLLYTSPRPRD